MFTQEIIGKEVVGLSGYDLGKVSDVQLDEKTWRIVALEVHLDKDVAEEHRLRHRFRKTMVLINVEHVQGIGDRVVLKGSREDLLSLIASSPPTSGTRQYEEPGMSGGNAESSDNSVPSQLGTSEHK
jgi:sporulation protein YlmC with PRC-barrel domain